MAIHDDTRVVDLILDIHKDLAVMTAHMAEIKADMRTHIKRTDQVEVEVKYLHKQINLAHGAIALVGFAITLYAVLK